MIKMKFAATAVTSIICVFFAVFFLYPQIKDFWMASNDVAYMGSLLAAKEELFYMHGLNMSEAEELEREWADKSSLLPTLDEHIDSIVYISRLMSECGITEKEFAIGDSIPANDEETLFKSAVKLRGTGAYDNVINFLTSLEKAGGFYLVDEGSVSSANPSQNEMDIELTVTVFAAAHGFKEGLE